MVQINAVLINIPESYGRFISEGCPDCVHIPKQFIISKRNLDQLVQINIPITINIETKDVAIVVATWLISKYSHLLRSPIPIDIKPDISINNQPCVIDHAEVVKRLQNALPDTQHNND